MPVTQVKDVRDVKPEACRHCGHELVGQTSDRWSAYNWLCTFDARGQAFGQERLRCLVYEKRHAPTEEIVAALDGTLRDFVGTSPRVDDVTIVAVKRP